MLRDFLTAKELSKRAITAIKYGGGRILVNDEERTVRWGVESGDRVSIEFPPEEIGEGLTPEFEALTILAEDDAVLIVEKPTGQGTIPSRNQPNGTLANQVAGKYAMDQHPATVHIVTRLDTNTSGIVCIAKNRHIHHLMSKQLQETGIDRRYVALVSGWLTEDVQTIEVPNGRKDGSIIERKVRRDGQYARTDVRVEGRYELHGHKFTKVALQLHTGRTHQIRVHMSFIGHPLIGDDLYGGPCDLLERQALHCSSVSFRHPTSGQSVAYASALPQDLHVLLMTASVCQLENSVNLSG